MNRKDLIDLIFSIAKDPDAFDVLDKKYKDVGGEEIQRVVIECGVMPEIFGHDSSEEKLWALYVSHLSRVFL